MILLRRTLAALLASCCAGFLPDSQQPLVAPSRLATSRTGLIAQIFDLTPELKLYIAEVMQRWHVPGLAVAIIQGNETWTEGFGYASLPSTPVTPYTLFHTGSTTKSFTAAGVSLLIDNSSEYSSIKWTTPISSLLGQEFVLSDEWATNHVTIEDALSHRTGYPRHDLAISRNTEEISYRLRHLPMTAEPRVKFQYNNHMFATVGYLITKLSSLSLGDFFYTYLWSPMGMNHTFLSICDPKYKASGLRVAEGYWYKNSTGEYIKQPPDDESLDPGAGAIISNVIDYTKYLRVMMAEAKPISKDGHCELKTARSFYSRYGPPFVGPTTYSLGWASGIFQDEQVWYHGGAVTTYRTEMLMIPSKDIGIVVMTNSPTNVVQFVQYRILYDLFNLDQTKRFDHEKAETEKMRQMLQYLQTCPERLYPHIPSPPLQPTLPLVNHTGEFHDPGYGSLIVKLQCTEDDLEELQAHIEGNDCQLQITLPEDLSLSLEVDLEHKTGDYWIGWAHVPEYQDAGQPIACLRAQFRIDEGGEVSQLGLDVRDEGEDVPLVWFDRIR